MTQEDRIRSVLAQKELLGEVAAKIHDNDVLYDHGLTSLATVDLMLALEDEFEVEFPDDLLKRETFQSVRSLSKAISGLAASVGG
jgi:acyl carrier protein